VKKFSDTITIISFFAILIMFAVSTLFFQQNFSLDNEISKTGSVKVAVSKEIRRSFPLSNNWKTLYANLLVLSGREQFDGVFLADDRLVSVNSTYDENDIENNVEYINEFAKKYEIPTYLMTVPTAAGIYSASLPQYFSQINQKEQIDSIYMSLDKSVSTVDAYYSLYSARDEYIYYRTENMWTSFGAYYAYYDAIKQLGFEPQTLVNYDQEYVLSSFTGRLYSKAMYSGIEPDRINLFRSKYQSSVDSVEMELGNSTKTAKSVYFRSALKSDNKTDIYLLGDSYEKISVFTNSADAPKLLIIKGSYANTFVPFLTPHYSEITLVDPKKIKEMGDSISDFVNVSDYDQILILFDIDSFANADYFDVLT
jgi:hypothetical protein